MNTFSDISPHQSDPSHQRTQGVYPPPHTSLTPAIKRPRGYTHHHTPVLPQPSKDPGGQLHPPPHTRLTPAIRQRTQGVICGRLRCLWEEEASVHGIHGAVVAPLLPVVPVGHHLCVGSLPRGGARVVVHVVHTAPPIHTSLPAATPQHCTVLSVLTPSA